jgi:hypothetical protein
MLFGRLIRGLVDFLGRSLIGARLGGELGRVEAADDIGLLVRVRPFDSPSFLSCVPGLANVNYPEYRHAGRLNLRPNPRNLGKIKTVPVPKGGRCYSLN